MTPETPQSNVILHHLENSRSQRILWLLEELEIPYEIKIYKRTPERRAPKELLDLHPLGKSPVVTDGPGLVLAESGAIVEYLINRYGKEKFGVPEGTPSWVQNLYWTHYSEGSLQPLITRRFIDSLVPERSPFIIRPIARALFTRVDTMLTAPELERNGKMIEARLKEVSTKGGWFAGTGEDRPTSADFVLSFTLEAFVQCAPECAGENVKAYVQKIYTRPAYKRVLEKGGEYALLAKE